VLEVLEGTVVDAQVIDTCRELQRMGYALALDDFVPGSDAEALLPFVKFVKVDVLATAPGVLGDLAERLRPRGIQMIAEKVETSEVADDLRKAGYRFLQGYFFCRPTTFRAKTLQTRSATYMQLLAAFNRPGLCAADLEELIKTDVSLSHRVLRCV